ncbi:hypothetical protein F5Y10DRAFT_286241 [Nemania abortiva]|nr:hypothetical protein F5Y10DRAFT_286241 [Nemania abortiva]
MAMSVPSPTDSLQAALGEFQSILSDEDRQRLQKIKNKPEADAAIQFTATLDRENAARRKGPSISSRLYSVLLSVQHFSTVVDTFVSANPSIAALVWGTVKLTMLIVTNFLTYYEETSKAFLHFDRWSPRFSQYRSLFPTSVRLQAAVCEFHASIIRCCKHIVCMSQRSWQAHLASSLTKSFQSELGDHIRLIKNTAQEVDFEIELAKAQSDVEEQQLQRKERALALSHRSALASFISKSNAEILEAQNWRAIIDRRTKAENDRRRLDDISTFDYITAFNQARSKRYHSTGGWVFRTPEWCNWKDGDGSGVFWLSGKIGSGKTVLSATVTDHLLAGRRASESISFFFPRFDYAESLVADNIIRSLIRQNLHPDLVERLSNDISKAQNSFFSQDTMLDLLVSKMVIFSTNYLLIDSLDEFEPKERRKVLQILSSSIERSPSRVKIFVASRDALENEITEFFPMAKKLRMNISEVASDLELFARQSLSDRMNMGQLATGSLVSFEAICDVITRGAQGMFLWVALEIDDICSQNLPTTLTDVLTRTLLRILAQGNQRIAREIFKWLQDALSIEIGESYSKPERRPERIEKLTAWCANLVEIDEVSNSVQFVHHSVRTYPNLSQFHDDIDNLDTAAGELCVTYLEWNDFNRALGLPKLQSAKTTNAPEPQKIVERALGAEWKNTLATKIGRFMFRPPGSGIQLKVDVNFASPSNVQKRGYNENTFHNYSYPFLEYAKKYWIMHTRLLTIKSPIYWSWKRMLEGTHHIARTEWTRPEYLLADQSIIAWAQTHSHFAIVHSLLSSGQLDVEQFQKNACELAEKSRNLEGIRVLFQNIEELTPSHWTREKVISIKIDVVTAYLIHRARLDLLRQTQDRTILKIYRHGTPLLDNEPNIDAIARIPGLLEITYFATVQLGLDELMAMLLVREPSFCDVPAGCVNIQPLQVAIMAENVATVDLLLRRGANPNQPCSGHGWSFSTLDDFRFTSLLHLAIYKQNTAIMRLLLDNGGDVNYPLSPTDRGKKFPRRQTGYDWAEQLIDRLRSSQDLAPLHCAVLVSADGGVNTSDIEPMKLLLRYGANPNISNSEGLTPIFLAVRQLQPETLKVLLQAGADPTIQAANWQTAEEYAFQIGFHVAKELIRKYYVM